MDEEIICQGCGTKAIRQSDEIMGGSDFMFICPCCRSKWMAEEDIDEYSLPLALEGCEKKNRERDE